MPKSTDDCIPSQLYEGLGVHRLGFKTLPRVNETIMDRLRDMFTNETNRQNAEVCLPKPINSFYYGMYTWNEDITVLRAYMQVLNQNLQKQEEVFNSYHDWASLTLWAPPSDQADHDDRAGYLEKEASVNFVK